VNTTVAALHVTSGNLVQEARGAIDAQLDNVAQIDAVVTAIALSLAGLPPSVDAVTRAAAREVLMYAKGRALRLAASTLLQAEALAKGVVDTAMVLGEATELTSAAVTEGRGVLQVLMRHARRPRSIDALTWPGA